jgi:hypothetical protein
MLAYALAKSRDDTSRLWVDAKGRLSAARSRMPKKMPKKNEDPPKRTLASGQALERELCMLV